MSWLAKPRTAICPALSDIHEAANRGSRPVVIYVATLPKDGAPPSIPVSLSP